MNSETTLSAPAPKRPSTVFDVAHILWRWRLVIAAVTVLGLLLSAAFTLRQTKIYEAKASALVDRQSLGDSLNNIVSPGAQPSEGPRVLEGQALIAKSPVIAQRTLREVQDTGLTVNELLDDVTVEPDANSDVLHFTLQNPDGNKAIELVNTYISEYVDYATGVAQSDAVAAAKKVRAQVRALNQKGQTQSLQYTQLSRNLESLESLVALTTPVAQVISTATSYDKAKPKLMIAVVLGIVLGLGLGMGLAFLLEALDPRLRTARDVSERVGLPLLVELPASEASAEPVTLRGRDEAASEAYRVLLAAVDNVGALSGKGALLVTSDAEPERASAAAVNLAIAAARAGHQTALLDLGFADPALSALLGAADKPGVSDSILGSQSLSETALPVKIDGGNGTSASLSFFPAGNAPGASEALIGGESVRPLVDRLVEDNDIVIVDAGGTASSSGAMSVSGYAGHTLLVSSIEDSRPESLEAAHRSLALGKAAPAGVAVFS